MVNAQDIVERYVYHIENNISDVNSYRASQNKKWVYDDIPRTDITSYPRISVIAPTEGVRPLDINYSAQDVNLRIQVTIFVKKGEKHTINSVLKRDIQVLNYLAEQVSNLFRQSSVINDLRNYGVVGVFEESQSIVQNDYILIKQIIFKNIVIR